MDAGYALIEKVAGYAGPQSQDIVECALALATEAYVENYRLDGHPYIHHAIAVAEILASWSAPANVVAAGLLHDVPKEINSSLPSLELIQTRCGSQVADIVQGVVQLARLSPTFPSRKIDEPFDTVEHLAKRLPWVTLVLQRTPLAVVVKIADRLDNFRSLDVLSLEQQEAFAASVMNIFAPLADRLGMRAVKRELENSAFRVLQPEEFQKIRERYPIEAREAAAKSIIENAHRHLTGRGLEVQVSCAPHSLYSLYRHEVERGQPFPFHLAQSLLILTNNALACYQALGLVHELWPPQPGEIRDYIAASKPNGYRGLHTQVRYQPGEILGVRIRDNEMHLVDEHGMTASWLGVSESLLPNLPEWKEPPPGKILVFTLNGDLKILPKGATPIDFAYAIHRGFGHQCTGAVVNGSIVPLDESLCSGDVVKILTSGASVGPSPDWLNMVKTSKARREIRRWLDSQKPEEMAQKGWDLLNARLREQGVMLSYTQTTDRLRTIAESLGYESVRQLLAAIGLGRHNLEAILPKIQEVSQKVDNLHSLKATIVSVEESGLPRRYARCCRPLPPDLIVGYVTKENLVVIHRADCGNVRSLRPLITAEWDTIPWQYKAEIEIIALDRIGLVRDVSTIIAEVGICMASFHADQIEDGSAHIQVGLGDISAQQLDHVFNRLKSVPDVRSITPSSPNIPFRYTERSVVAHHFTNPYTLAPVSGNRFYGRRAELRELVNNLRYVRPGEAVLFWGPRRVGKTSLLLEFQRTVMSGEDYLPVFIDMQRLSGSNTTRLLFDIMRAIAQDKHNSDITIPTFTRIKRDPLGYFRSFVENTLALYGKHIVLILDEFQILSGLKEEQITLSDVNRYFRSLIQHRSGMSIIFSGGGVLDNLLQQANTSSLLEVTRNQRIGCLTREEARQLIVEPVKRVKYDSSVVERLLDLTAGHPYYLQLLCGELVTCTDQENNIIKNEHLNRLLSDWLPDQGEQFFGHLWGSDSGIDRITQNWNKIVLTAIAFNANENHWVNFSRVADNGVTKVINETILWQVLQNLVKMETLETKDNIHYRIKVELFEHWLQENYAIQRVVKEMGDN
ncbi:MAG: HD domain-containing protein [Anaerolineae bacterium]|nr:HD domain-containing protein [Anaerolineae bacterium]